MKQINYSDIEKYIGQDLLFKQVDNFGKETGEERTVRLTEKNSTTVFGTCSYNGKIIYWNMPIGSGDIAGSENNYNIYLINDFQQ